MQFISKSSRVSHSKIILAVFIPIFLMVSMTVSSADFARSMDFAFYWQAANMTSRGEYVYDEILWSKNIIRPNLDTWFHYPYPLAILISPLGWLDIETAYTLWIFFIQCALLISMLLLSRFYTQRTPSWQVALLVGLATFRPFYVIALSGQLDGFMLLVMCVAIYLSNKGYWLGSGLLLTLLSLKPSFGLSILALFCLWLLFQKKWHGLLGIFLGGSILLSIGMVQKPYWIHDYLAIGQEVFANYAAVQPTIWGGAKILFDSTIQDQIASIFTIMLLAPTIFILRTKYVTTTYAALSIIIPVSLIIAPYAWAYNQILLVIPLIYISTNIALIHGSIQSILFIFVVDAWAIFLTMHAYQVGHDVWSLLVPGLIFVIMLSLMHCNRKPFQIA